MLNAGVRQLTLSESLAAGGYLKMPVNTAGSDCPEGTPFGEKNLV